jgi:alanine racemase
MSIIRKIDTILKNFEKKYETYNYIKVSKSAILHNIQVFEKLSEKQVIPVLKGNAYGHGIQLVAKALKGKKLPYIAVDGYFEALKVREVSRQPVLVMGMILPQNYKNLSYDKFAFVVDNEVSIHALGKTKKHIKIHLECNTGMNRYGAEPENIVSLARLIQTYPNLKLEGFMSHLADSDGDNPHTVEAAVEIFDTCVENLRDSGIHPPLIHIAQTAGSLKAHSKYANSVRVGIGTYGINPFPKTHRLHKTLQEKLKPALSLESKISKIIELEKGDKVSYNYTFTAPKKMRIGVLPLGYFEGVNRSLSNTGLVKIGESYAPIVGRVCMNHTMISLENIDATVGAPVTIYSSNPNDKNSVDSIAQTHNLFNYNMLTALSSDVRRKSIE